MHETKKSIIMIFLRLNRVLMLINFINNVKYLYLYIFCTKRAKNIVTKYLFEFIISFHLINYLYYYYFY